MKQNGKEQKKRRRGRPVKNKIKPIDATPEELARAIAPFLV